MFFEIIGDITDIEVIAIGKSVRQRQLLRELYGEGRWRKMKGRASIRLSDGIIILAELHWVEAHGIGRKRMKIKRLLEPKNR